jgi:AcrR family transcriptional regulator
VSSPDSTPERPTPLNGRRAEARRNNERILVAAREVLIEGGYDASMASIAERAGVGIGTLYRRYPSKDELIAQMSIAGMDWITDTANTAAECTGDAWAAFTGFMRACVDAGAGELMQLAGKFPATAAQRESSERLHTALERLLTRTRQDGGLTPDVTAADVYLLFAHLRVKSPVSRERSAELQQRYLDLVLRGMRADATAPAGPAPTWTEIQQSWQLPPPETT